MSLKRKILPYNPNLISLAKQLRKQGVLSEVILWHYLKGGKIFGLDFVRQKPIDNYIVDFYCPDLMLAIEIDGASHGDKIEQDEKREKILNDLGVKILHFKDRDVKKYINEVLEQISDYLKKNYPPLTPPRGRISE